MKLHPHEPRGINLFTHLDANSVGINGRRYAGNVAVTASELIPNWTDASFATLSAADFAKIAAFGLDVALLGTGSRLRFPARELLRPLYEQGRSIEIMDTPAACRTFNILVTEGRRVGAFLLVDAADENRPGAADAPEPSR